MKKSISLYGFIILALSIGSNAVFAIPTLTEATATGTTVKFTTKLSEKLPTGYKVKIDLNNGKGLVAMTCSGLTCSLSSNALPKLDSLTYKIGIYDSKGVMKGELLNGTYTNSFLVTASGYSKISNSGSVLPDTATLGSGANDWGELEHMAVHSQGNGHHHHDDLTLHMDDNDAGMVHQHADSSTGSIGLWQHTELHVLPVPRGTVVSCVDALGPAPFLDALLRPPQAIA